MANREEEMQGIVEATEAKARTEAVLERTRVAAMGMSKDALARVLTVTLAIIRIKHPETFQELVDVVSGTNPYGDGKIG